MNNNCYYMKIFSIIYFLLFYTNFYSSSTIHYELNFVKELTFNSDIGEIFISDPNVIDVTIMAKKRILITAKGIGKSIIRIKDKDKRILVSSTISVTPALTQIRKWVKELYPNVRIEIVPHGRMIFLLGKVPSPKLSMDIEKVVKTFVANMTKSKSGQNPAPQFTVMNKMSVDMAVQVMLKVKVVELSREISKHLGIEWNGSIGQSSGATVNTGFNAGLATNTASLPFSIITGISEAANDVKEIANHIGQSIQNGVITNWSYGNSKISIGITNLLNVLESESVTSVLAEPTLVAVSGQQASFSSGGKDSYLVYSIGNNNGDGNNESVSTQFKEYGVNLNFVPTVISENAIVIALSQQVSAIKANAQSKNSGPSLEDRSVNTTVQLANGQTIAVAGMLRRNVTNTRVKSGLFANLPVIGELFGNKQVEAKETEVVITVTPYIIKPVKEQFFYPMNGISKEHPEDDKINDNVTKFDKNLGVSKDYNKHTYKIGGGGR